LIATRVAYFRAHRLLLIKPASTPSNRCSDSERPHQSPDSICNHATDGDPLDREKTITALTMDLTNRRMSATWGNPCENVFTTFQLE